MHQNGVLRVAHWTFQFYLSDEQAFLPGPISGKSARNPINTLIFMELESMPIYEYECQKCGTAFELMQSISARPPKSCIDDKCKGKPRRLVSRGGFILKGTGWYATDYPTESRKKGWEQESGKSKEAPAGGAESASAPDASKAAPSAPAPKEASPLAKAQNKNPYTGGSKKSRKATKSSQ